MNQIRPKRVQNDGHHTRPQKEGFLHPHTLGDKKQLEEVSEHLLELTFV